VDRKLCRDGRKGGYTCRLFHLFRNQFVSLAEKRKKGDFPLSSLKDGMVIKFIGGGVTIER